MARKPSKTPPEVARIEWLLAAMSALLVLALLGFLVLDAVTRPDTGPSFALQVVSAKVVGEATYVDVTVRNLGAQAAADVVVQGQSGEDSEPNAAEAILDYAPPGSDAHVTLVFDQLVQAGSVQLRISGFREP